MNLIKPAFLWDSEVKNKYKRSMLDADVLEVNFELKTIFMAKHPDITKRNLAAALGLTAIRQLPAGRDNTRWVARVNANTFLNNLNVWQAFMLICGEQAIAISWDNKRKDEFEGVLFAQTSHAMDWGVFDPGLFTRFEENQHA